MHIVGEGNLDTIEPIYLTLISLITPPSGAGGPNTYTYLPKAF